MIFFFLVSNQEGKWQKAWAEDIGKEGKTLKAYGARVEEKKKREWGKEKEDKWKWELKAKVSGLCLLVDFIPFFWI